MYLIICIDDKGGMMFNRRRQTKDRTVTEDIAILCQNGRLYLSPYSALLWEGENLTEDVVDDGEEKEQEKADGAPEYIVTENPLERAGASDYCFVETGIPVEYIKEIERLICYRWNRKYPADVFCGIDFDGWELDSQKEWKGYSHDKITRDIYSPRKR